MADSNPLLNDDNTATDAPNSQEAGQMSHAKPIGELYQDWFLDYASYVILDRAVPYVEDGLKPVQRRILHAMREMDDGRYNKVANIIGQTMQYHPHGDASIGDAMVGLGQKDLLIDTQGNWGNPVTGDSAAAPRYIEARLSKFALDVAFNPKTTTWQLSYDGRKQEPVTLPMKFPLLLAQGVEGIAVGLSTKILPHNFLELIDASIKHLQGQPFELYPDFLGGGMVDVSEYNQGKRGGRIRIRAHIREVDKKTLAITSVPYGSTTLNLIESITKAVERGKIKIKHVDDNTAKEVEIVVQLAPGVSPDVTIDALYAFTDCEVAVSPNCCIIVEERPVFTTVTELLRLSVENTLRLLTAELNIRLTELNEDWHMSSLEKIFIENRIYRDIEEEETFEGVLDAIDRGLTPYKPLLRRAITRDDILKLTEIRIKRISKYDSFQADEHIRGLEAEMLQVQHHLAHIVDYAVDYYQTLRKKYGKGRERRTEIRTFDTIQATVVAAANQKLYVNRTEGFIGIGAAMRKDEFVADCSDLDDVIVFRRDGKMLVTRVSDKAFVGKDIEYVAIFRKNDDRMVYHLVYQDGGGKTGAGIAMVKRFQVQGVTRDKEYDLTKGTKGSSLLYFSANPNGEREVVKVALKPMPRLKKLEFDFDLGDLQIKGRQAAGNILTRNPVRKVTLLRKGPSTLGGRAIWWDDVLQRLNVDGHGEFLGRFESDDRLLVLYADGSFEQVGTELTQRFDSPVREIGKYNAETPVNAVYYDGERKAWFAKRFLLEAMVLGKKYSYISEVPGTKLLLVTTKLEPVVALLNAKATLEELAFATLELTGWKAVGKKLPYPKVTEAQLLRFTEPEPEPDAPATEPEPEVTSDDPELRGGVDEPAQGEGTLF